MRKITLLVILTLAILIGAAVGIITFFEDKKVEKEELISNVIEDISISATKNLTITIIYDNNPYNVNLPSSFDVESLCTFFSSHPVFSTSRISNSGT